MARVEVTMPKMGESITEGTVLVWHKQPGDPIEQDETLLEIGTDKVDTEVPSAVAGTLGEILVKEGETVDVGTSLAWIETEGAPVVDEPGSGDGAAEAAAAAEMSPDVESPQAASVVAAEESSGGDGESGKAGGPVIDVVMPKMGESIVEGTILKWFKGPGDSIRLDETLLEIATDKVDTEVPSPAAGVVRDIVVPEGETVEVGTVIGRIESIRAADPSAPADVAPASDEADVAPFGADEPETKPGMSVKAAAVATEPGSVQRIDEEGRFYSPLVRSIASKEGVSPDELRAIQGTGRDGRVTKKDLMVHLENRTVSSPPKRTPPETMPTAAVVSGDDRVEVVPMDRMRQIIAEHMIRSKSTSAHVTSFTEADVTGLVRLREARKATFLAREGVKLTYTPFFVKAAVEALQAHPLLNSSVEGTNVVIKKDYHVGIAVALGQTGLVVPVVKYAGQKNIAGLARDAAVLAERARSKELLPDDLQGGTFTVTNIGSLGSLMGTPIISQPQVAILATGAIKKRPIVIEDPDLGDLIAIRHMMFISLSYDHRIIDGAMSSSFLHHFVKVLESYDLDSEI